MDINEHFFALGAIKENDKEMNKPVKQRCHQRASVSSLNLRFHESDNRCSALDARQTVIHDRVRSSLGHLEISLV